VKGLRFIVTRFKLDSRELHLCKVAALERRVNLEITQFDVRRVIGGRWFRARISLNLGQPVRNFNVFHHGTGTALNIFLMSASAVTACASAS
jgi:hypothetical protein